jgi:hypothetical protein
MSTTATGTPTFSALACAMMWRGAPMRDRLLGTTAICETLGHMVPRPAMTPPRLSINGKVFELAGEVLNGLRFAQVGGTESFTMSVQDFVGHFGANPGLGNYG